MLRALTPWFAMLPLIAQAPKIDDLLSADWRVRNHAARALWALPGEQLDVDGLLRVLKADWPAGPTRFGLFGGRAGHLRKQREPRE